MLGLFSDLPGYCAIQYNLKSWVKDYLKCDFGQQSRLSSNTVFIHPNKSSHFHNIM